VADNIILWAITMPGVSNLSGYIHNTYLHNKLFSEQKYVFQNARPVCLHYKISSVMLLNYHLLQDKQ